MMKNMKRKVINIILVSSIIGLGAGFELQQVAQETAKKPEWEQETAEKARQIMQQRPEWYNIDDPYTKAFLKAFIRASQVGMVGVWKDTLQHPDAKRRAWALKNATPEVVLAETAVPEIIPLLKDESGQVRFEAAAALLRFGNDQGVAVLLDLLRESDNSPTWQIIPMLVRHKRTEAVPVLRDLFEKATEQIRAGEKDAYPASHLYYLAQGIGAFGDRESAPLLDRYFYVRSVAGLQLGDDAVVEAAGRLDDPQLAGWLQDIFSEAKEPALRVAAAFGLAKLGDESAHMFLIEQASFLRGMPESEAVNEGPEGGRVFPSPALREWSEGKPPIKALIQAVFYLGELKTDKAFPLLKELTLIENEWALQAVIRSLSLVGNKKAVPTLVELTKRKNPIPLYAARALLFFDGPEAQDAVRRVYQSESERGKLMKEAKELGPAEFLRH